jgi:hypothetical protein
MSAFGENTPQRGKEPVALRFTILRSTAILLTGLAVLFHVVYAVHAGGLWRDEVQTLNMAGMPTIAAIWDYLPYGSFPMLWYLILRAFEQLFTPTDLAYRLLGCGVGLSLVAALWVNARVLKFKVPLISLALLGFSPVVLRWGDSVRAYGFGTALILLNFAALWKVVTQPSRRNIALAGMLAIASVQAIYHNTVLLLGLGVAGMVVALLNGQWRRAAIVAAIGLLAASSMLPYVPSMLARSEWNMVFLRSEFELSWFLSMLIYATEHAWAWPVLVSGAALVGVRTSLATQGPRQYRNGDQVLFCLVATLSCIAAFYGLFRFMRYPSIVWNYIPLLALVALAVDGLWSGLDRHRLLWAGRPLIALAIAAWSFTPVWKEAHIRQTNVDVVAARLHEAATANDLLLVTRWHNGISFARYYRGSTPWMSLPPMNDFSVHRFDLLKEQMAAADPIQPVIDAVTRTLQQGHRVYLVGDLEFPSRARSAARWEQLLLNLEPAPVAWLGWDAFSYQQAWALQMGVYLRKHAKSGEGLPLPLDQRKIHMFERHRIWVLEGWRD